MPHVLHKQHQFELVWALIIGLVLGASIGYYIAMAQASALVRERMAESSAAASRGLK